MPTQSSWRVSFSGEIVEGFEPDAVKATFIERFRLAEKEAQVLFSGRACTLKKNISRYEAEKFSRLLAGFGAVTEVVQDEGEVASPLLPSTDTPAPARAMPRTPVQPIIARRASKATAPSWRNRWHYRVDTFMAKGGSNIFKALLAVSLAVFAVIAVLRGVLQWLAPEETLQYDSLDFWGNVYITFLQVTDPGNMAQDILSSPGYKVFAVLAGLAGVILLSALIAFITTALDQKINEMKRGHSKVIESGHTLILGWDAQRIIEVLRELVMANESESDACVVILADQDKQEMDDVLRARLPDTLTTRVITRSGKPSIFANLDRVSIDQCKSVVVISEGGNKSISDARVIQTILAAAGELSDSEAPIVAEIYNETHRQIVADTFSSNVVTVSTAEILAKLLVQTSRSVGLSTVYSEILSFDGCELYFYPAKWRGCRFYDAMFRFPDGVPIGVRTAAGEIRVRPDWDYVLQDDDEILIVATDDSTIDFRDKPVASPAPQPTRNTYLEQGIERELLIGWNDKASIIINEYAEYVMPGSEVDVLMPSPSNAVRAEIERLDREIDAIRVRLIERNPLDRDDLLALNPFAYNNIIILANGDGDCDRNEVDSENIVTLLLLRSIFQEHGDQAQKTKLITEVLDSQNYSLVHSAGVKDVIISNRLVSMIVAQISESPGIKAVYDDLFSEDGSEIYLKPLSLYYDAFPVTVSFADLMAVAKNRDEICIGVKITAQEEDIDNNCGVSLVPTKDTRYTLGQDDCLVVVAEDEL